MARARAIDTRLEKLIPSTDELFVVGILSKEETQQLVKDRTFHEYKLVARPLLLVDVRNAIKFELALEKKIADFCAEFNRKAALEASGVDEKGKKKAKSGAPVKKLNLKHRWAVQERIEQIYRIGLRHLFTQRKTASLLQLKRKATLTTAPLTGVTNKETDSEPLDDYEILRRECVAQLTAFSRQISLSKLYAEWLTRAPQDAFLWSEAALFEATYGRNDEARAIIQQALATLRQTTTSSTSAGTSAQATSTISVRLAGKDFLKQRASEESKEVWGTALVIEILFAKRLLEGAIETAVRANDKTPADSVRGENAALAAIVLDLALAEAIVSECAQPAIEGHMPFLCPDLGLYLYSVAVCHQFTAGLCRSILLQALAVATKFSSQSPSSASYASSGSAVVSPMSLLLTELFLTDIRFTATNCVTAEQFITEKALGDLGLLEGKSDGDELRREWVVRNIHRKHRIVSVKEKKEKVLSSIGAALTLILAIDTAETAMRKAMLSKSEIDAIIAFVQKSTGEEAAKSNNDDDDATETVFTASLFTSLLRTVISSAAAKAKSAGTAAAASLSTLNSLKCALSDAIVQLMSLSTELAPIHLDDAQDALRAYNEYAKEAKAAKKAKKEKAAAQDKKAKGDIDEEDDNNNTADLLDPEAFLMTTNKKIFLFSQPESSRILRIVLLLEKNQIGLSAKRSALTIVSALEKAVKSAADVASDTIGKKSKAVTDAAKKEAVATLELFRELCLSASILTQASNEAEGGKKKKKGGSRTTDSTEIANRRTIVKIGTSGAQLLKSFAEVAFANSNGSTVSVISPQSVDLVAAASQEAVVDEADNLDGAFEEDVSPTAQAISEQASDIGGTPVFSRSELWWASTDSTVIGTSIIAIMDTKFLSVRMTPLDLVTLLGVAQPLKKAQPSAGKQTAASSLSISTREEVAVHVSRVLALVDNEAALAKSAGERHTVERSSIRKIAEAIQTLICTAHAPSSQVNATNVAGSYLPYEPSVWRLFAALQHSLGSIIRTIVATENTNEAGKSLAKASSLVGLKSSRDLVDSSDSDDENEKRKPKKKKLRIGNNGATASSSVNAAASVAAATSVISQRDELNNLINNITEALESTDSSDNKRSLSSTLVELARRLFHISLQIVAGGTSHASLPTFDLRAERLKGILALVTVEVIREIETAVDANTNPSTQTQFTFNSPAIFLAAQVLQLQKLFHTTAEGGLTVPQVHGLLTQLTRIHNLLLPPIRILELEHSSDPLSHGFCTPITRALLRSVLIPAYGAAYVAASGIENASDAVSSKHKAGLVAAAEKAIHSLITNLTALYTVEVKEAGKLGNGIRNSTQYAVVQKKEVSDHIAQNRSEAFLPYFFLTSLTDGGFAGAASSAAVTKTNIINAQVNDWLLALVFEQQYTKNLTEARGIHARAVQTVEAPQNFLASVAAGSLPALY